VRRNFTTLLFVMMSTFSLLAMAGKPESGATSLAPAPRPAAELTYEPNHPQSSSSFHPRIKLSDGQGQPVHSSGQPIDINATCGSCHDVKWIGKHGFHFAHAGEVTSVLVPSSNGDSNPAPNCFFCHVRHASAKAAQVALNTGDSRWVATATLLGTGVVNAAGSGRNSANFQYTQDAFAPDGSVSADQLQLGPPTNEACGTCHGIVSRHGPEPADWLTLPTMTERTGQVFSPARVSDSTINLKGRDHLARAWDIHAERLLRCSDCHFAPNDPRSRAIAQKTAETLRFEPRHAGFSAFLQRPSHDFAHGPDSPRCDNCHEAPKLHAFLPHLQRHLSRLSCETCHIPKSLVPALAELNLAIPMAPGQTSRTYRGAAGDIRNPDVYVEGFDPAIVLRRISKDRSQLVPVNFITTWTWHQDSAKGARISQTTVERALLDAQGHHRSELVSALDRNGDGRLDEDELLPDTKERANAVMRMLEQAGVTGAQLVGEVRAETLHHGVVSGRYALRDCTACHAENSRLLARFELTARVPTGATLVYSGDPSEISLAIDSDDPRDGAFARLDSSKQSTYVFGSSRSRTVDSAGLGFASLVLLGALTHGALRLRVNFRKRKRSS
jgi:hypothetical protein